MLQLNWEKLQSELKGELYVDDLHRSIYATDASVYRIKPLAVFFPKDADDISVFLKSLEVMAQFLRNSECIERKHRNKEKGRCNFRDCMKRTNILSGNNKIIKGGLIHKKCNWKLSPISTFSPYHSCI